MQHPATGERLRIQEQPFQLVDAQVVQHVIGDHEVEALAVRYEVRAQRPLE